MSAHKADARKKQFCKSLSFRLQKLTFWSVKAYLLQSKR